MPPKAKIQTQDIVQAALELVRESGIDAVSARAVAARLGCSTQPVFSNFPNMESLWEAIVAAAHARYEDVVRKEAEKEAVPLYKSYGMAYIRFAQEESNLFRLLFADARPSALSDETLWTRMVHMAKGFTNDDLHEAERMHAAMWLFVHGLASLIASERMVLTREEISQLLTDQYENWRCRINAQKEETK